ncbi:chromatin modification-related protein eaf-1 [Hevea brasiliensis]|uniref:chromatin modification-related protein eaf-1 n=1 Tax=Hevea brasiliensis TaxID=3981 RepID=UPI0025FFB294|nr:chromatin modification-related protein eaf-1 [Hevea brasiliensis]
MHRQVQEHAQNCPGVQPQTQSYAAQDATAPGTTPVGGQAGNVATQVLSSQTAASSLPGQDPNQQANRTALHQSVVQATVPTAEQWYQQLQQYQQNYQLCLKYDPYQQHYQQYYPYLLQAAPQYKQPQVYGMPQLPQPQVQPQAQLQTQSQSHPHVQLPAGAQPVNQPQVNPQQQTHMTSHPQSQTQSLIHPPPHGQQQSQATHPVQHHPGQVQMPQYPQPHSQVQHPQTQVQAQAHSQLHLQYPVPQPQSVPHSQGLPQTNAQHPMQPHQQPFSSQPNQPMIPPHLQTQPQHSSANAVTDPQPQPQQQMQLGGPQHPAHFYPQGGPQPQSHLVQMQSQFPQQPLLLRPPQSQDPMQNPQQPGLLPSPGQVPNVPPSQQQPALSHFPHPGLPHQRAVMQSVQQQVHQQYVQQEQFSGQGLGPIQNQVSQQGAHAQQQLHVQSQLRPLGPSPTFHHPSHAYPQPQRNVALPHGRQSHQAQILGGRPLVPSHGVPAQPHPHSSANMQVRPMQVDAGQSGNSTRTNDQDQLSSEQQSGATARLFSERKGDHIIEKSLEAESTNKNDKRDPNDLDVASGVGTNGNKPMDEVQDISESLGAENGGFLMKQFKKQPKEAIDDQKDVSKTEHKRVEHSVSEDREMKGSHLLRTPLQDGRYLEDHSMKSEKNRNVTPQHSGGFSLQSQVQGEGLVQSSHSAPIADHGKQQPPLIPHGPSVLQQRPVGSPLLQAPPLGPAHCMQLPGHPSALSRPLDSGHMPHPGQPFNPLPEHLQQPLYKQSLVAEVSPAGIADLGSTSVFGRDPSHYGPQGPYTQGHGLPLQGERTPSYGHESDMFPNQRPNYADGRRIDPLGQQIGMHTNAMGINGAPGPDSSEPGLRDDLSRPLPDEHKSPFLQNPARIVDQAEFEEDTIQCGNHLPPSTPLDRVLHGFGMDLPLKPHDKGLHAMNHEKGMDLTLKPRDNTAGSLPDSARTQQDLYGLVHRYGPHHMDGLAPGSPGGDYPGKSSHRFGASPGLDDISGRESHQFGDSFHGNRFLVLPSHLHRPGFRSNFSLKGIPGDGGFCTGDLYTFDGLRRRKASSMGWCRICKVDCETVEGLDMHSQTREHQKIAMDMVVKIKQNAKKQKL